MTDNIKRPSIAKKSYAELRRTIQRPKELMRARHPEFFSDTRIDEASRLPKVKFEYYLDTLTSRKQECQFEHFCRKLVEKEICPNIRVQTGPTGGGDSKVDTETYPVAAEIAERWLVGLPSAGAERWAFAFSAKKRWKDKLVRDVKSILSTDRGYRLIYFFTNQFVSDKVRADSEDTLSKQTGIPIHIIDRAWIVEKVYSSDRQCAETYFAALGIEDTLRENVSQAGPRDVARRNEMDKLDRQIADPSHYFGARYQLVEDCLRSAILARNLERSRSEVESRFIQTDRLSAKVNDRQQRLRVAYNRAWTAYWWYEDYVEFCQHYDSVERYVQDSDSVVIADLDLLFNLWMLLLPSKVLGKTDQNFALRTQCLTSILTAIEADSNRPNSALQARTNLILLRATEAFYADDSSVLEDCWSSLGEVVDQSHNLVDYSIERLFDSIREIGKGMESISFDSLYEKLISVVRARRSDGEAGLAYLDRARQKMERDKPYDAIRWLGHAERLLSKEEYRGELVVALVVASSAFEKVGLHWAARSKALAAAERALADFSLHGSMNPNALVALNKLVWVELRLGRIPQILSTMTLARIVASHLTLSEDQQRAYVEDQEILEFVLGIHFLNLTTDGLRSAARLPDTLQTEGLVGARIALLFALGHEQILRDDGAIPKDETPEEVQAFFRKWREHPAAKEICTLPTLGDGSGSIMQSTILGVKVVMNTPDDYVSIGIAEAHLGALEVLLAISEIPDVLPFREQFSLTIRKSAEVINDLYFVADDDVYDVAEIVHSADFDHSTIVAEQRCAESLLNNVIRILSRAFLIRNVEGWIQKVAERDSRFFVAFNFGSSLKATSNIFGDRPRVLLSDWISSGDKSYALRREMPWIVDDDDRSRRFAATSTSILKHGDYHVAAPIDIPLWDRAKWRATGFILQPGRLPILAIAFESGDAGELIFRKWREDLGCTDDGDLVRVAIITGLSKQRSADYSIIIGPNYGRFSIGDRLFLVSRINRMAPVDTRNLDMFLKAYKSIGRFVLTPTSFLSSSKDIVIPHSDRGIVKQEIHIRQAWTIGENDPDSVVLEAGDDPIIPDGELAPPVEKVLEKLRSSSQESRS